MTSLIRGLGRVGATILLIIVLALGAVGFLGWLHLFREVPEIVYESDRDHFNYASIGTENREGMPYLIWAVLPELFKDKLEANGSGQTGYASFGMLEEPGRDTPIGITRKRIGFERQGINCAVCHTASFRTSPEAVREVVAAGPSVGFDSQGYLRFLFACARDPRFNADELMPLIKQRTSLGPVEQALYRNLVIPQTKKAILALADSYAWMDNRPTWGPGRIDPFNPVKFRMLGLPDDGTVGNSDMMPLWNEKAHVGFSYHWDGLERSLRETIIEGALGDGATLKSVNLEGLKRVESFINEAQPPSYPFPIDQARAAKGATIFSASCAVCHAPGGARTGTVIPLTEVGTDQQRLLMWTQAAVDAYSAYADGYPYDFKNLQKTDGYVAVALDGLWLRGPYLHNGSVPNLEALLTPPQDRPQVFIRGYDVIDRQKVGFISSGKEAESQGWRYEVAIQGNGNQGHSYGTELSTDDRKSLLEYLKTL